MDKAKSIPTSKTNISNVLILGGYGRAGIEITKLLIGYTTCQVTLAGRNKEKADKAVESFDNNRVNAIIIDAGNSEVLEKKLRNFDLVIVSMPIASVGGNIVKAAIKAGIHYIDLNLNDEKHKILNESAGMIENSEQVFISESGFVPGLPSFLTRLLYNKLTVLNEVEIAAIFREKEATYGSCLDFIQALASDAFKFNNGRWEKASVWKGIKCDFGHGLGVQPCYPVRMFEMEGLAEKLELNKCGIYGAGINKKTDTILLVWKLLKLYKPKWGVKKGAELLYKASNNNVKPPYITLLKATGHGYLNNMNKKISISLSHVDGYVATAIPVVALILQLLDGTINQSGVFAMGEVVNVLKFEKDLVELGLGMEVKES